MSNLRSFSPGTRPIGMGEAGTSMHGAPKFIIIISSVAAGDRWGLSKSPGLRNADTR